MQERYEDVLEVKSSNGHARFGGKLRFPADKEGLFGTFVQLPDLVVEPIVVILIEFLVFQHPVGEILDLESPHADVDVVFLEDHPHEPFHNIVHARCPYFNIVSANLHLHCRHFLIQLGTHLLQDVTPDLALNAPIGGVFALVQLEQVALHDLLGAYAGEPASLVSLVDCDEMGADVLVDEFLVVEDVLDFFLGVIIELGYRRNTMVRNCL